VTENGGWSALEGMRLEAGATETVCTGEIDHQSPPYGLLNRVRDPGVGLVSVKPQPAADSPHRRQGDVSILTLSDASRAVACHVLPTAAYGDSAERAQPHD
jgi:hypothetical protein